METIAERIKELIDTLHLSNSEFAKQTNLNPATVSHILGGRNKASLQVIENIKAAFTNVNIDYLITGEGSLFTNITNVNTDKTPSHTPSMFPMEGVRVASIGAMPPPEPKPVESEKQEPIAVDPKPHKDITTASLPPANSNSNAKSIDRIVIFYSDGTFSSYHP